MDRLVLAMLMAFQMVLLIAFILAFPVGSGSFLRAGGDLAPVVGQGS